MINVVMTVGNVICLAGTLLLIRTVIKDRAILNGYSPLGSLLTFLSICTFQYGFYLMNNLIGVLFGLPTIFYWLTAFAYSIKARVKKK